MSWLAKHKRFSSFLVIANEVTKMKEASGAILYCEETKRVCLNKRSAAIAEPGTWATWGGGLEAGETPEQGCRREILEESGYQGEMTLSLVAVTETRKLKYHTFIAKVPSEFTPTLCWESEAYIWTSLDKLPNPLHFGLRQLLPMIKAELK